jgi:hypothetical protein
MAIRSWQFVTDDIVADEVRKHHMEAEGIRPGDYLSASKRRR